MSTVIISVVSALVICIIYGAIHKGWIKSEIETLHNRINAANSEAQGLISEIGSKVQNAKAIASNALSSAQRAENKIVKHVEGAVTSTVETEVANA